MVFYPEWSEGALTSFLQKQSALCEAFKQNKELVMKTKTECMDIAKAGASLTLNLGKYTKTELMNIAKCLVEGATLTLIGPDSKKTKTECVDIARAAGGNGKVNFMFTD